MVDIFLEFFWPTDFILIAIYLFENHVAHTVTASQIMMHINCLGNWSNADSESLAGLRVCICDIFSVAAVPAILQAKLRKLSYSICHGISSVQFAQSCLTLCDSIDCSTPDLLVHHQLPEFTQLMSIELVMPSNHLILCRPLLLLPSIWTFANWIFLVQFRTEEPGYSPWGR